MGHWSVFVWFSGSWVTACDTLPALLNVLMASITRGLALRRVLTHADRDVCTFDPTCQIWWYMCSGFRFRVLTCIIHTYTSHAYRADRRPKLAWVIKSNTYLTKFTLRCTVAFMTPKASSTGLLNGSVQCSFHRLSEVCRILSMTSFDDDGDSVNVNITININTIWPNSLCLWYRWRRSHS